MYTSDEYGVPQRRTAATPPPPFYVRYRKSLIAGGAVLLGGLLAFIVAPTAHPNVGFDAVLVKQPWIFGHGGVDPTPIKSGLTYVAPTTSVIYVCMQPIQAHVKFDDLMSSDGVPLDFDAVIRIQVTDSVKLISIYGDSWYETNIEREFMNRVRQAVRKHGMNETAISTVAIKDIDDEVSAGMEEYLRTANIPVRLIQVTVGKANPPDSIKNQRIETASQEQRIRTEGQKKLAEDAREQAELSRAKADNAYKSAMGLSPSQYVQLEAIKMQEHACTTGARCTFIAGTNGATPLIEAK